MNCTNFIYETSEYAEWFRKLRDMRGRARIAARVDSAKAGNFGDCKVLDEGICELRIDVGPGYRVYYAREGLNVYLLIVGGDKSSQTKDIARAKRLWKAIKEERQ